MNPTRRVTVAIATVSLFSLAIGWGAGTFIKSPAQVAAETDPPPYSVLTAVVETGSVQQDLLATGTVALGNKIELSPPSPPGMDNIATKLPVSVGTTVGPGTVLLEVADRPILLLAGDIPQLRDLHRGDKGRDVERLQQALQAFGGPPPDGAFGPATEQALKTLYQRAGYAPPMDESDHAAALRSELVFAPDGAQGEVVALGATLGGSVTSPAVTVTTKPLIVASEISQTEADALILGTQATITGPGLPAPLTGHVDSIGTLTAGADGGLRVPVQVSVDGALSAGAINSLVQVSFDTSASAVEGLLVPLSALHADTDATTTVIVINGDEQTHVAVTVSETGGGVARVQSLGGELRPGDRVVVGST